MRRKKIKQFLLPIVFIFLVSIGVFSVKSYKKFISENSNKILVEEGNLKESNINKLDDNEIEEDYLEEVINENVKEKDVFIDEVIEKPLIEETIVEEEVVEEKEEVVETEIEDIQEEKQELEEKDGVLPEEQDEIIETETKDKTEEEQEEKMDVVLPETEEEEEEKINESSGPDPEPDPEPVVEDTKKKEIDLNEIKSHYTEEEWVIIQKSLVGFDYSKSIEENIVLNTVKLKNDDGKVLMSKEAEKIIAEIDFPELSSDVKKLLARHSYNDEYYRSGGSTAVLQEEIDKLYSGIIKSLTKDNALNVIDKKEILKAILEGVAEKFGLPKPEISYNSDMVGVGQIIGSKICLNDVDLQLNFKGTAMKAFGGFWRTQLIMPMEIPTNQKIIASARSILYFTDKSQIVELNGFKYLNGYGKAYLVELSYQYIDANQNYNNMHGAAKEQTTGAVPKINVLENTDDYIS